MSASRGSIAAVLQGHVSARSSSRAIREPDRDWTYGDLGRVLSEIAATLAAAGVTRGACVAVMLPNSGAFVASFFAIAGIGGVIVPFNVRYREQEIVYYIGDARAAAIVISPDLAEVAASALEGFDERPAIIEVASDGRSRCTRPAKGSIARNDSESEDPPLLRQYTSGSTGTPKRVVRTHGQLLYELARLQTSFELSPGDRFLGVAPFSHVNGLVRSMMTSIYVGGTLYPIPEFRRRLVLDVITRERITHFGGVPYMYALLADTPVRGTVDLASLRVVFSASAPLLAADNRRFAEKYGTWVRQLYGSTETGTISVNLCPDAAAKLESVGLPLPGVRVAVQDDEGRPVPAGTEGEVAISSPAAIRAYDGNPEANASSFRAGFYLSGDLGILDEDGYLTLTGRKKFLINRAGYKINPLEVEAVVRQHPKVKEVVVLGAPAPHGDEIVRCVAVTTAPCTAEEIADFCRTRIADFKIPSRIEFRDELPKTPTGKVLRHEL